MICCTPEGTAIQNNAHCGARTRNHKEKGQALELGVLLSADVWVYGQAPTQKNEQPILNISNTGKAPIQQPVQEIQFKTLLFLHKRRDRAPTQDTQETKINIV